MSEKKPRIADTKPLMVELPAGDHFYCACGETKNQAFCDGSHVGKGFTPLPFSVPEATTAFLCMCRESKNLPYCDGSHAQLPEE